MQIDNMAQTHQVDFKYCLLFDYDKQGEDIFDLVDSISIKYDLFKTAISCEIQVTDSVGFLENFPIIGDEMLAIGFKTPTLDKAGIEKFTKELNFVFNIYRVENRKQTANRAFTYTLYGVSSEAVNNFRYSVNRTYYDWKAEHIAQDIFHNYLRPSQEEFGIVKRVVGTPAEIKPFIFVSTTEKKLCLNFSNENPLSAIKRVCLEAEYAVIADIKTLIKYKSNVSNKSADDISSITRITAPLGTTTGLRNNNPGNILTDTFSYAFRNGIISSAGEFAVFKSPEDGIRAIDTLLKTYSAKYNLNTISGIINKWAPRSKGFITDNYINSVATLVGIDANATISIDDRAIRSKIISAIITKENGAEQAALVTGYISAALDGKIISKTTTLITDSIPNVVQQPLNKEYAIVAPAIFQLNKTKSSSFIFYENDDGWNFKTIDYLLSRDRTLVEAGGSVQDFYFVGSQNDPQETKSIFGKIVRKDQKITELNFEKQMNNAENMERGLYASTLVSLDPLTKQIETDSFVYDDDYEDIGHLETLTGRKKAGIFSEQSLYSKEKIENHATKNNEFLHKNYIITNLGKEYTETDGPFKNARATDHQLRNPKNFHEFLKYDYAEKVQFNNMIITFTIPGNSDLQVGDTVNLNIPTNDGTKDGAARITKNRLFGSDKFGGYFLVSRINHVLTTNDRKYVTHVECIKDIYATTLKSDAPSQDVAGT